MTEIAQQLIEAARKSTNTGYEWTLASQLGEMLQHAELKFGLRDSSYSFVGFEFFDGGPQIWYPGNCRNIVIQIGTQCLREPDRACFQLAHEVFHLLGPTGEQDSNVLEEGLATHYQIWYMANHYPHSWPRSGIDWSQSRQKSYDDARIMAEQLMAMEKDVIKRLRKDHPALSKMSTGNLLKLCPNIDSGLAIELTKPFER